MTCTSFAALLDSTYLKPFGGPEVTENLCREAAELGCASVAVNGADVARCAALLAGTRVKVTAVAGFPLGQMTTAAKRFEVEDAIAHGAGEVDFVQNVRALQSGDEKYVADEFALLAGICRASGVTSKVILENCYLTRAQIVRACTLARNAGLDFVKTSTGFGTGGATAEDVALMRATVGPAMGVKAAGGIRTLTDAQAMIAAGATRLGTSAARALVTAFANAAPNGGATAE